jgi:hypothetical protein
VASAEEPGSNWHPVIQNAIDKGHELELVYQGNNDLKGVQRTIIPTGMRPGRQPGTTALRAFDPSAGIHKEFRTDRIVKMLESRPSSVQPIPVDPEAPSVTAPQTVRVQSPTQATAPVDNGLEPIYVMDYINKCPNCGASTSIATNGVPTPPTCRGKSSCGVLPGHAEATCEKCLTDPVPPLDKTYDVLQHATRHGHGIRMSYQNKGGGSAYDQLIYPTSISANRIRAWVPSAARPVDHEEGYGEGDYRTFLSTGVQQITESFPRPTNLEMFSDPLGLGGARPSQQPQKQPAQSGWIVESPTLKPSVNEKTGDIEPTDDEYAELKALDIDPDTHDKATVRRLRNNGATHMQLKEVTGEHGLPLEDYEQALQNNNGNHTLAVQEAQNYRSRDNDQIQQNRERNRDYPNYAEPHLLSDNDHEVNANMLFVHHLNLKNAPEFGGMYKDLPGRRRANEWILSELSKIQPSLKGKIKSKFFKTLETLQGDDTPRVDGSANVNYFRLVNQLDKHHGALMATATSLKDLTKQRRIRKALANIGNARFYPNDYSADVYEED